MVNLTRKFLNFKYFCIAPYNHGDKCLSSIQESLNKLKTNYIDLILIHWPGSKGLKPENAENSIKRRETWKCLEQAKEQGLVNLIGISNYNLKHLNELLIYSKIKPNWLQVLEIFFSYYKKYLLFFKLNKNRVNIIHF